MGYDMGLGGCWPARYYLAKSKLFKLDNLALLCSFFTYVPTCLRTYNIQFISLLIAKLSTKE
jgi:hypothetical protein